MEHLEQLVELLRPLGVYDLRAGRLNREELECYARPLDEGAALLDETAREMALLTAEGFGLDWVEELLTLRPASPTMELRRQALAALLRIGGDSFTAAAINDTLTGCGINARVEETEQPGRVEVYFPDVGGIPLQFEQLRVILEEILPCHAEVTYVFWYRTWGELMTVLPTWGGAVDTGKTWYQLATWKY